MKLKQSDFDTIHKVDNIRKDSKKEDIKKEDIKKENKKSNNKGKSRKSYSLKLVSYGEGVNVKNYSKEMTPYVDFEDFKIVGQEQFSNQELHDKIIKQDGLYVSLLNSNKLQFVCNKPVDAEFKFVSLINTSFNGQTFYKDKYVLFLPEIVETIVKTATFNSTNNYIQCGIKKYSDLSREDKRIILEELFEGKTEYYKTTNNYEEYKKNQTILLFLAKCSEKKAFTKDLPDEKREIRIVQAYKSMNSEDVKDISFEELLRFFYMEKEIEEKITKFLCKCRKLKYLHQIVLQGIECDDNIETEHIVHPYILVSEDSITNLIRITRKDNGIKAKCFDRIVKENKDKIRVFAYANYIPLNTAFDIHNNKPIPDLYLVVSYLEDKEIIIKVAKEEYKVNFKTEKKRLYIKFKNLLPEYLGQPVRHEYVVKLNKLAENFFDLDKIQEIFKGDEDGVFLYEQDFNYDESLLESKLIEEIKEYMHYTDVDKKYSINIQHIWDLSIVKNRKVIYDYECVKHIGLNLINRIDNKLRRL